jgi:hypothetical protein
MLPRGRESYEKKSFIKTLQPSSSASFSLFISFPSLFNPVSNQSNSLLYIPTFNMQFGQLSLALAVLAGLTNGAAVSTRATDALRVTLSQVDNALIKAVIQNIGADDLNLLALGTILDKDAGERLNVFAGGT